ncbi:MAG: hypothetical protein WCI97_10750 [Bacteroidota bacterium]
MIGRWIISGDGCVEVIINHQWILLTGRKNDGGTQRDNEGEVKDPVHAGRVTKVIEKSLITVKRM